MIIYLTITRDGLTPAFDSDREQLKRLKIGTTVKCDVRRSRSYQHHKKFMALVRMTFDNLPERYAGTIQSVDDMLYVLKMDMGRYIIRKIGDYERLDVESISFDKMSQDDFDKFYSECCRLIRDKYVKGLDLKAMEEVIDHFL